MGKEIDEKKLQEAKAKLACHIEPPKQKASDSAEPPRQTAQDFIDPSGKVLLTQMTTAGG